MTARLSDDAPCALCDEPHDTLCDVCSRPVCYGCIMSQGDVRPDDEQTLCVECNAKLEAKPHRAALNEETETDGN